MLRFSERSAKVRKKRTRPRPRCFSIVRRFEYDDEDWEPDIGQPNDRVSEVQGQSQC
jgi:hypothetical protein